jgi:hypothetical protein
LECLSVGQIKVNMEESKFKFSPSNLKDQFKTEDIKFRGNRNPSYLSYFKCDFSYEKDIQIQKKKKKKK